MEALYADVGATGFRRSFSLSHELETDKIKAEMKDGLLTVTLPKRAELQPRRIQVDAG
jgi:HSP20 family molecular chaperone IbpA